MKKSIIIKGLASVALLFGAASCSSDYLDMQPISEENSEDINDNVSKMRAAMYLGYQAMRRKYSNN